MVEHIIPIIILSFLTIISNNYYQFYVAVLSTCIHGRKYYLVFFSAVSLKRHSSHTNLSDFLIFKIHSLSQCFLM